MKCLGLPIVVESGRLVHNLLMGTVQVVAMPQAPLPLRTEEACMADSLPIAEHHCLHVSTGPLDWSLNFF
jgi:hypothetical protein